jgi:enoyl-CoA hydratase/carnithine racemase
MVQQLQEVMDALEADEQVRVWDGSRFRSGPPWPDFLARLTRLPVASIALIRGRATA